MDLMDISQTWILVGIIGALAVLALVAWFVQRKKQAYRPQERFGPASSDVSDDALSRAKAASELKERESRA